MHSAFCPQNKKQFIQLIQYTKLIIHFVFCAQKKVLSSVFCGHNVNSFVFFMDKRQNGVKWFRNKRMAVIAQNVFSIRNKVCYTLVALTFLPHKPDASDHVKHLVSQCNSGVTMQQCHNVTVASNHQIHLHRSHLPLVHTWEKKRVQGLYKFP